MAGEGIEVLLVEDDADMLRGLAKILRREGFHPTTADRGDAALSLLRSRTFDCIVTDLKMPGADGMEILRAARRTGSIPVIIITAYGTVDNAVEAMRLGAVDYVTKPFQIEQVVEGVKRAAAPPRKPASEEVLEHLRGPILAIREGLADLLSGRIPGERREGILHECKEGADSALRFLEELGGGEPAHTRVAKGRWLRADMEDWLGKSAVYQKGTDAATKEIVDRLMTADDAIARHGRAASELIQILLAIQEKERWLPSECLFFLSHRLGVPLPRIYQAATFYKAFSLKPTGRHTVRICLGTACHVRGARSLVDRVARRLGIRPGDMTPDGRFSLFTVNCMGCCALGPVMALGDDYYSRPAGRELEEILARYE